MKGVRFADHVDAGDPAELAQRYRDEGADEIVIYDIAASAEARSVDFKWLEQVSRALDVPLCVAGGIRTLAQAIACLEHGADKVSINSPALERPDFIDELARAAGSQCVVVGVDSRLVDGAWRVFQYAGSESAMRAAERKTLDWITEAQEHGLAPLIGSATGVGAVGYTLGGGMGWLARKFGLASDQALGFEAVTAEGEIIRANADQHPDLFWALRGGGGANYALVTAMEQRLFPVTQVYGGSLLYPAELAQAVFRRYREWAAALPDEMTSSVLIMNYPNSLDLPDPVRGRAMAVVRGCYAGDTAAGKALLDEWRSWQAPAFDLFGAMPFMSAAIISHDPPGPLASFSDSTFLADLSDGAIDAILAR